MTSGSLQTQCMFYEDTKCYLHAGFPTECRLCFNFSSPYKVIDKGKTKVVYSLMDVIKSRKEKDLFFPKGNEYQKTL